MCLPHNKLKSQIASVFCGVSVDYIHTPKLCIIQPSPQWTALAISNEREKIALLVVSLAGPPDGGNCEGRLEERREREETIKDQMSSRQSDAEM